MGGEKREEREEREALVTELLEKTLNNAFDDEKYVQYVADSNTGFSYDITSAALVDIVSILHLTSYYLILILHTSYSLEAWSICIAAISFVGTSHWIIYGSVGVIN